MPFGAIFGPKAMLTDEYAGSGGDAMPYYFRKMGIGPLIGKRTWGGLVRSDPMPALMDGGIVTAPPVGIWAENGEWVAENKGMFAPFGYRGRPGPRRCARWAGPATGEGCRVSVGPTEGKAAEGIQAAGAYEDSALTRPTPPEGGQEQKTNATQCGRSRFQNRRDSRNIVRQVENKRLLRSILARNAAYLLDETYLVQIEPSIVRSRGAIGRSLVGQCVSGCGRRSKTLQIAY